MNCKHRILVLGVLALIGTCTIANAADELPELEGVFGVSNVEGNTALAFWIPLGEGESISGIRWFNNDGSAVFPEILAVAGDDGQPELLSEAMTVGQLVDGESLQWRQYDFEQPLASAAEGLYVIWRLPSGGEFTKAGADGGAGFGYVADSEGSLCWVTGDGEIWDEVAIPHQLAAFAIMNSDKSSISMVLQKPGMGPSETEDEPSEELLPSALRITTTPNPFNPVTIIRFTSPVSGVATVSIYDLRGRLVKDLLRSSVSAGTHEISWNGVSTSGRVAPSGLYFVRVACGRYQETVGITLMK